VRNSSKSSTVPEDSFLPECYPLRKICNDFYVCFARLASTFESS
jgi:hypothetical protein